VPTIPLPDSVSAQTGVVALSAAKASRSANTMRLVITHLGDRHPFVVGDDHHARTPEDGVQVIDQQSLLGSKHDCLRHLAPASPAVSGRSIQGSDTLTRAQRHTGGL